MADKARDKATKRKKRPTADAPSGPPTLRLRSDPREERRYEGKTSPGAAIAILVASVAAVSVGAGTYAQWFRAEELGPHKYAFAMLAAGAAALFLVLLFGPRPARTIRVGDAGIGLERDATDIDRIAWCDVERVSFVPASMLTFQSSGGSIAVPIGLQPQAAARAMAEARKRIPAKVAEIEASLPAIDPAAGEIVRLEPPQVAGLHCKKSDKLIAFERDARLCGRCGELYHKDSVPSKCLTCDARL